MSRKGKWCECGNPKLIGHEGCPRCEALDGTSVPEATVIAAIRSLGGTATPDAIQLETSYSYRQFRRACARLEKSGRVRRVEDAENVRSKNIPTLHLRERDDVEQVGWVQLAVPKISNWLGEVDAAAAGLASRVQDVRRTPRRARRALGEQLRFAFAA